MLTSSRGFSFKGDNGREPGVLKMETGLVDTGPEKF
jgi:hypothetical protein